MGGAKKRSIVQTEKQQTLQLQKEGAEQKSTSKAKSLEKKTRGIDLPTISDKDLSSELAKIKAITPYALATRYNIKLSIAKDWLNELEKRGLVQITAGARGLKIYKYGS